MALTEGGARPGHRTAEAVGPRLAALAYGAMSLCVIAFVWHATMDVPVFDDWIFVHTAWRAEHHLSLTALWSQNVESRLLLPRLVVVVLTKMGLFSFRLLATLTAVVDAAAGAAILAAACWSTGRRLAVGWVVLFGLAWFSLTDVVTLLWFSCAGWVYALAGLAALLAVLAVPTLSPRWAMAAASASAVVACLAAVQGFVLWPIGAVAWWWSQPAGPTRRRLGGAYIGIGIATTLVYALGYRLSAGMHFCPPHRDCSLLSSLAHPGALAPFFFRVLGLLVPFSPGTGGIAPLVLGGALLVASAMVLVSAGREHRQGPRVPVAAALVAFGLAVALMTALGRLHYTSGTPQYYAFAARIAWAGVVLHLTRRWGSPDGRPRPARALGARVAVGLAVVAIFVASLVPAWSTAERWHVDQEAAGRLIVNAPRLTPWQLACGENLYVAAGLFRYVNAFDHYNRGFLEARTMGVAMFSPGLRPLFLRAGPPDLGRCG